MWNTESSRKAVLAEGRYVEAENGHCLAGRCCLILISAEQISLLLYCHSWYYILQW